MIQTILKDQLIQACTGNRQIIAVYLFGSYATKTMSTHSDIDIAVVVRGVRHAAQNDVYDQIGRIHFPAELDLVIVDRMSSPLLLFEIVKNGILIYAQSENDRIHFESTALHIYYDTNHLRNIYASYLHDKFNTFHNVT